MKECRTCRQLFAGDDLRFCRFDGSPLTDATPPDEGTTILFPSGYLNEQFKHFEELRSRNESGKLYE
jgi:hypothetical protein